MSPEFDSWYRRTHPRLLAGVLVYCGNLEAASDAVDEACARALARWGRVGGMDNPQAWAYRVAINYAKRKLRRARLERQLLLRRQPDPVLHAPASEAWDAVRFLPQRQRAALVLRYIADLPEADIAKVMGVSRGTVASTLSDARSRLGLILANESEEQVYG